MKKKQRIVGLTGGIASGKSTVSQLFVAEGVPVIDTDEIAGEVGKDKVVQAAIKEVFGERSVVHVALNRPYLASIIFSDDVKRRELNNIIHPRIKEVLIQRLATYDEPLVVVDVPLMYETDFHLLMDEIIVVYVPEAIQLQRLMRRNQLTEEQALERIHAQLPLKEKVAQADYVLDNSGTEEELSSAFKKLYEVLTAEEAEGSE